PDSRAMRVVALVAPLLAGLVMFAFSRHVQFLALSAMSPIVMAATVIDDRRTGRLRFGEQLQRFRVDVERQRRTLDSLRRTERIERARAAPDLAELARRAELRTVDLWARHRHSPDFLHIR